jgi:GAF domain-containing protein
MVRPPVLGVNRCALLLWEGGKPRPLFHEARTDADKAISPLQAALAATQASGRLLVVADARVDPRFQTSNPAVAAVLCAPVPAPAGSVALLYADAREPRSFMADDLACFETIASLAALAIRG